MNKKILLNTMISFIVIIILFFIFFTLPTTYKNTLVVNHTDVNAKTPLKNEVKVAVFSDVHLFFDYEVEDLQTAVNRLNNESFDVLIFDGDLIQAANAKELEPNRQKIINVLNQLRPIYGKFAILGDNDVKLKAAQKILTKSGFEILSNKTRNLEVNKANINLIGIRDINKAQKTIEDLSDKKFNLLVAHNPKVVDEVKDNKIDMIITAHTLGGQYNLPFYGSIFSDIRDIPYYKGHTEVNDIQVFNTNGLGTERKNIRFLAPSSIDIFTIK